jgi:pantetheine-phosphate adenylyltransferase
MNCALSKNEREFKLVAVGGTFDEFHRGHRALLCKAFQASEKVLIGLSTDLFASKVRKNHKIAPFAVRLEELKSFIRKHGWLTRTEIIPLHDPCGPLLHIVNIDAIIVSKETEKRAHEINFERKKKNLASLEIVVVDMVLAENYNPISTTRIRHMEIDREGRLITRKRP